MSPTDIPTPQPVPGTDNVIVDQETAETVKRIQRVKAFAKSTFKNVGVPVLIGSAAAYVVSRRCDQDEQDSDLSDDTNPDE